MNGTPDAPVFDKRNPDHVRMAVSAHESMVVNLSDARTSVRRYRAAQGAQEELVAIQSAFVDAIDGGFDHLRRRAIIAAARAGWLVGEVLTAPEAESWEWIERVEMTGDETGIVHYAHGGYGELRDLWEDGVYLTHYDHEGDAATSRALYAKACPPDLD